MSHSDKARRVVMIGAGGHARVCLEALRDCGHVVLGAVSLDGRGVADLGVEMLGPDDDIEQIVGAHAADAVFPSIGHNAARASAVHRSQRLGLPLVSAISRFAMLSDSASVGSGAVLMPGAVVNAATRIGVAAIVNTNASVDHDCDIGDFVHIAPGVAVAGGVRIGPGALVGIGARVLQNVTIGAGAVIGGATLVNRDVPDGAKVVGVPGRLVRDRSRLT